MNRLRMGLAAALYACAFACGSAGPTQTDPTGATSATGNTTDNPPENASQQEVSSMSLLSFDLTYAVSGGQVPVRALLKISRDGQAQLELGTYRSLPAPHAQRVGRFASALEPAALEQIDALVRHESLLERKLPRVMGMPGMLSRSLTLQAGSGTNNLGLGRPDAALDQLESLLVAAMRGMLASPIQAVEVATAITSVGAQIQPEIVFTSVGPEAIALVFFDPDMAGRYLRCTMDLEPQGGTATSSVVPREHIVALTEAGGLPVGVHELQPGQALRVSLPAFAAPAGPTNLTITASFYLAGPGPARLVGELQAEPVGVVEG